MLNRLLQQIGLVNHSVPQNDSGDAAYQRAIKLAQEILPNGPVGVKMAKQAINKGMEVSLIYLSFFSRKLIHIYLWMECKAQQEMKYQCEYFRLIS